MSNDDLEAAIKKADGRAPVFGDAVDFENAAIFRWLSKHEFHGPHGGHLAIGDATRHVLPIQWMRKALVVHDIVAARAVIARAVKDPHGVTALRRLYRDIGGTPGGKDADVHEALAAALTQGRLWTIEVARIPRRAAIKTDPAVFTRINAALGTDVDFDFIADLEGDQWLTGYVPVDKTGIVSGKSGMTIATGFDIGQYFERELKRMGFSKHLLDVFRPFTAPHNFRGLNRKQVEAAVAHLGPVPSIKKKEADAIDEATMTMLLKSAIRNWNGEKDGTVPAFVALPSGWQTVWLSRTFQDGPNTDYGPGFGDAARSGQWADAISQLRAQTKYRDRKAKEVRLLEAALPPPLKPAKPAGAQR